MWVGQLGGGDGLASGAIPDWIAPIMTAIHHLLVMRSECRRGRSRRSPRSCAGARSRASTVNRGRRFAAPLCAEPARRGASVSGAACTTLRETRHALARTLATPAGSRRSPQHRGLAPHRVRSRPGPGPSGPERRLIARPPAERTLSGIEPGEHVHSWPSAGSPSQHHRSGAWAFRCMTIAAFVLTAIDRRYVAEDHLRVLCIPFVAGRAFGEADHRAAGRARGPWSTRHSPSGSAGVGGR